MLYDVLRAVLLYSLGKCVFLLKVYVRANSDINFIYLRGLCPGTSFFIMFALSYSTYYGKTVCFLKHSYAWYYNRFEVLY